MSVAEDCLSPAGSFHGCLLMCFHGCFRGCFRGCICHATEILESSAASRQAAIDRESASNRVASHLQLHRVAEHMRAYFPHSAFPASSQQPLDFETNKTPSIHRHGCMSPRSAPTSQECRSIPPIQTRSPKHLDSACPQVQSNQKAAADRSPIHGCCNYWVHHLARRST